MRLAQILVTVIANVVLLGTPALAQSSQFSGSCQVRGPYGAGCVDFYDGTWTDEQMLQICHAVSARRAEPTLDYEHKCLRDSYARLCVSQQLYSIAYIYIDKIDELSCHGILNGKLFTRPATGW